MIDWGRVHELRSEIGADDFGDVAALFLEEADEVVGRLSLLTDAASMERDLHFLKGCALNLGFSELAEVCQNGERRAASRMTDISMSAVAIVYSQSRTAFLDGMKALAA
ncbi:MAG: Hpt domain-containing protein [Paracoccaceae bacterium]